MLVIPVLFRRVLYQKFNSRHVFAAEKIFLRQFSRATVSKGRRPLRQSSKGNALAADVDPWVEVKDQSSGQVYFWNTKTNETTALGHPKPSSSSMTAPPPGDALAPQPAPAGGGITSGLGRVVAEGFAFGVGSSIARSVVGSMFGGDDGGGGSDDSGDSFDV